MRRSRSLKLVVIANSLLILLSASPGTLAQGSISPQPAPTAESRRGPARGVIVDLSIEPNAGAEALLARDREAATDRTPQLVIGDDGRQPVVDSTQSPYRSVALTESYFEAGDDEVFSECTSTFVGPKVLITAASCLYSPDYGMTNEVLILPGVNGADDFVLPDFAANIWVPQPWIDTQDPVYNYALVIMEDDELGNAAGWLQLAVLSTEALSAPDLGLHMISYPTDKPVDTQWESSAAAFVQVDEYLLWHDMDTASGQSGAAIMRSSDHAIVGIHNGGSEGEGFAVNVATRIEPITLNDFLAVCQDLGCTIDYFIEGEGEGDPEPTPSPSNAGGDTTAFDRTWSRTDYPVASGQVSRTWMWGPPFTDIFMERYDDSPGGERAVIYHEKSRMEITNPSGDPSSIWYITNGLLVVEMISGDLQLGNDSFEQHQPAWINVAGDGDDPDGVTYATFAGLLNAPALPAGSTIGHRVDRNGNVAQEPVVAALGIQASHFVPETSHTIAAPFWSFMNSEALVWQNEQFVVDDLFENPYFATGYPITEAYWATVRIGGTPLNVLVQCFERRCLTYNPSNPAEWQVEAGNVGLHYHQWRYESIPNEGEPPSTDPEPSPTPPDNDGAPTEGEIVNHANLSTWPEMSTDSGAYGEPGPESYFMTTPSGTLIHNLSRAEVSDGSFSIDVRRVAPSPTGYACIMIRADLNLDYPNEYTDGAYYYCLIYEDDHIYGLTVIYETPEEFQYLASWEYTDVELPDSEWYQLKIIAEGGQFWLFLNETYIGTITHDGVTNGYIGVSAWNTATSGGDARYEFTNLTKREIQ